jgi:surface protein
MFDGAIAFNQDITGWNTASFRNLQGMFRGASSFNQPIGGWNISGATNLNSAFTNATSFNQPLNGWNVSDVTSMAFMFNSATNFNQPLNLWNTAKVTTFQATFAGAEDFNGDISTWQTGLGENFSGMFQSATAFSGDISGWDMQSATNLSNMFLGTQVFNADISGWTVGAAENMNYMFLGAISFNQDLSGWDVSSATTMLGMFSTATAFDNDLAGWCVSAIATQPSGFDALTPNWTGRRPLWGRCPADETPAGYSASLDQAVVHQDNDTTVSLTFSGAEAEADYSYTIASDAGGPVVSGSGRIATATDQITGIDLSALPDGTLTLTVQLTNPAGNAGAQVSTQTPKDGPGCPAIGDVCLDGSINAGITPDGDVRMYAAATDRPTLLPWNNGQDSVGNTWNGLTNRNTGRANTAALIGQDADTETPGTQP